MLSLPVIKITRAGGNNAPALALLGQAFDACLELLVGQACSVPARLLLLLHDNCDLHVSEGMSMSCCRPSFISSMIKR